MTKESPALRVLIVDDELLIRWSLSETLTDAGHTVAEAVDAESAIRTLTDSRNAFDVVILDYRLPDSSDLGLLADVRRLSPRSAVIMMTAYGTEEMTQGARNLGAYRIVAKPFEVHEMANLILEAHARSAGSIPMR